MTTTATARVNVYDGTIMIEPNIDGPDGCRINGVTIDPWGVDETGMERADAALAGLGLTRVGEWSRDEYPQAAVERA